MSDLPNTSRKRDLFKRLVVRASKRQRTGPTQTATSINGTEQSISASSNAHLQIFTQPPVDANDLLSASSSHLRTTNCQSTSPRRSPPTRSTPPSPSPSDDGSNSNGSVGTSRHRDFWAEAFAKLTTAEQIGLQGHTQTPVGGDVNNFLEALLRGVERTRDTCEKNEWKIRIGNREISVRDKANTLIDFLERFKAAGDIAVNADPVHAGLPWAFIRVLLQVSLSNKEQTCSLVLGLERVMYVLSRCKIYFKLYLTNADSQIATVLSNLEDALSKLYSLILAFLVKALIIWGKSTFGRVAHALWRLDDIISFDKDFSLEEDRVDKAINDFERTWGAVRHGDISGKLDGLLVGLEELKGSRGRIDSLSAQFDQIWTEQVRKRRGKVLHWTSTIPYDDHHSTAAEGRIGNTCGWLFHRAEYKMWTLSQTSQIVWLHGIPGAGKTKLTSRVTDTFRNSRKEYTGLAYFYCSQAEDERRRAVNVLRSFVKQLGGTKIDKIHQNLLQTFFDGIVQSLPNVKIFISSRRNIDIERQMKKEGNIGIEAYDNADDIQMFVKVKIEEDKERRRKQGISPISSTLGEAIMKTLNEKSEGMFQWASMQVSQLLSMERDKDIYTYLSKLPRNLARTYEDILCKIEAQDGSQPEIALRTFQWLIVSKKAVSMDLLLAAVCQDSKYDQLHPVDIDSNYVLGACQNLVTVDQQGVRHFSHLSVQEYLETSGRWTPKESKEMVCIVCLQALCSYYSNYGKKTALERLVRFASDYWYIYAGQLDGLDVDTRAHTLLRQFLGSPGRSSSPYKKWFTQRHITLTLEVNDSVFHMNTLLPCIPELAVCLFGFETILREWILANEVDVNAANQFGLSLLCLAIRGRSSNAIIALLLDHGADINACGLSLWQAMGPVMSRGSPVTQSTLDMMRTLLAYNTRFEVSQALTLIFVSLCYAGHLELIQLVLNAGADVNQSCEIRTDTLDDMIQSPLMAATGDEMQDIISFLLSRGADVNQHVHGSICGNALSEAAHFGINALRNMELLLAHGADVNAKAGHYGSPLTTAVGSHQIDAARLLILNGADVNMVVESRFSWHNALSAAFCPPRLSDFFEPQVDRVILDEMVHLLLGQGAHVDETFDIMSTTAWDNDGVVNDEIADIIDNFHTIRSTSSSTEFDDIWDYLHELAWLKLSIYLKISPQANKRYRRF